MMVTRRTPQARSPTPPKASAPPISSPRPPTAPRSAAAETPKETPKSGDPSQILPQEVVEAPVPAEPSKKVKVSVRGEFKIFVPPLGRCIYPGQTAELDDHRWIRRQIELGTFIEV